MDNDKTKHTLIAPAKIDGKLCKAGEVVTVSQRIKDQLQLAKAVKALSSEPVAIWPAKSEDGGMTIEFADVPDAERDRALTDLSDARRDLEIAKADLIKVKNVNHELQNDVTQLHAELTSMTIRAEAAEAKVEELENVPTPKPEPAKATAAKPKAGKSKTDTAKG